MITVSITVKADTEDEAITKIQSATELLGKLLESGAAEFSIRNQQDDGYYLLDVRPNK